MAGPNMASTKGCAMDKTKCSKLDVQGAVSAICFMGHGLQAIRELGVSHESGSLKAETLGICIDTMVPELLRRTDEALAALDASVVGGFSERAAP